MSHKRETYAAASVKAFIERDGKILILRESSAYAGGSYHGQYVMPGGKVNTDESFKRALQREVFEECGLSVDVEEVFHVDEWFIDVPGKPKHIVGSYFACRAKEGEVILNSEFDTYKWIQPTEYERFAINAEAKRAFLAYIKRWET